jgi:hypothetical protein
MTDDMRSTRPFLDDRPSDTLLGGRYEVVRVGDDHFVKHPDGSQSGPYTTNEAAVRAAMAARQKAEEEARHGGGSGAR